MCYQLVIMNGVRKSFYSDNAKRQLKSEEARDVASRESGVSWRFFCQPTARATLKTRGLRGFKASEKPVLWLKRPPRQAESLAAGVRPI